MSTTDWINFFGMIISGLIAGLFTYLGVKLTLDRQEKSRDIQSIENSFEKLYYPLQDVLKKSIMQFYSIRNEINKIGIERMFEADLDKEENKDVSNAWQIVIRNYYYFRKDYDKIIRFSYQAHSKKLEEKLREFIEDPGNEILRLIEDLTENWINLDIPKIVEIRKNIDKSFLAKIRDSDNLRRQLRDIISEDIDLLKSKRNKLIE